MPEAVALNAEASNYYCLQDFMFRSPSTSDLQHTIIGSRCPSMNSHLLRKQRHLKSQDFGLHVLVDQEVKKGVVDIVAVHGLNGHYERTWTTCLQDENKTPVNWLKDLLPLRVRNARIMSFAYNSTVQFSKSTADVYIFAEQLLEELLRRRQNILQDKHPLIFMVNKAHSKGSHYSKLLKCIHGVVFMGTPHRGSGLAQWGSILGSMLRAASVGNSTNSQLTKDLEENSRVLSVISESFIDRGQDLKIYSFYETEKLDYLNTLVVGKESATLGWPQEICVPLNANHRNKNETYRSDQSIVHELHTSDYVAHKRRNIRAVQGTCLWLFRHRDYISWAEEAGPSLLWISADPGCGKSNICFFFFKADSDEQRSAVHAISALLHQLYTRQPELIEFAQEMLQLPGHHVKRLTTLWRILASSADRHQARQTVCIIDGLDECEESSRRDLISLISQYFTDGEDQAGHGRQLKLLITSRPDNSIKTAFDRKHRSLEGSIHQRLKMIRLKGEDETDAISADVELVVKDAINDLIDRGLPQDLLAEVEEQIIARADRTFLWTSLIIDLLKERAEGGASQRELDMILRSRGVYTIYSVLLASKADHTKVRKLLNIILAALEPLTVEELNIALAIQPDHQTFEKSTKPRRPGLKTFAHIERELFYPAENYIKTLCGHFVRIIHGKVYLVHQTAREFLLDATSRGTLDFGLVMGHEEQEELLWDIELDTTPVTEENEGLGDAIEQVPGREEGPQSPWKHTFSLMDAHALLLEICATYLYMLGKKSPKSVLGSPTPRMSAFLRFASMSWFKHFHKRQTIAEAQRFRVRDQPKQTRVRIKANPRMMPTHAPVFAPSVQPELKIVGPSVDDGDSDVNTSGDEADIDEEDNSGGISVEEEVGGEV
ncbi:putative Ankyrin repeat protein [Seiridium cardinale]|uniref:Ankyrin repeat protein n=1 Tax=Seiridium cardinale TaxID=138064 RepID=A0ABR2XKD5_9PEZI